MMIFEVIVESSYQKFCTEMGMSGGLKSSKLTVRSHKQPDGQESVPWMAVEHRTHSPKRQKSLFSSQNGVLRTCFCPRHTQWDSILLHFFKAKAQKSEEERPEREAHRGFVEEISGSRKFEGFFVALISWIASYQQP